MIAQLITFAKTMYPAKSEDAETRRSNHLKPTRKVTINTIAAITSKLPIEEPSNHSERMPKKLNTATLLINFFREIVLNQVSFSILKSTNKNSPTYKNNIFAAKSSNVTRTSQRANPGCCASVMADAGWKEGVVSG